MILCDSGNINSRLRKLIPTNRLLVGAIQHTSKEEMNIKKPSIVQCTCHLEIR